MHRNSVNSKIDLKNNNTVTPVNHIYDYSRLINFDLLLVKKIHVAQPIRNNINQIVTFDRNLEPLEQISIYKH